MSADYLQFGTGHYRWRDQGHVTQASGPTTPDGVHTIGEGPGRVDLLSLNGGLRSDRSQVLIVFNGAVSDRDTKTGPFFSGRGLAAATGMPTLCVADTVVTDTQGLNLGWYRGAAGSSFARELEAIVKWRAMTSKHGVILLGGSAGGFAALDIAAQVGGGTSVLAWNPQVDILDYVPESVNSFLAESQGIDVTGSAAGDDLCRKASISAALAARNVRHDLVATFVEARLPQRFIVLQNSSDWHLRRHLSRLVRCREVSRAGPDGPDWSDDHVFRVRDYGAGHASPSVSDVVVLLRALRDHPTVSASELWASRQRLGVLEQHDSRSLPQWLWEDRSLIECSTRIAVGEDGNAHVRLEGDVNLQREHTRLTYTLRSEEEVLATSVAYLGSPFPLSRHSDWTDLEVVMRDGYDNVVARRFLTREVGHG